MASDRPRSPRPILAISRQRSKHRPLDRTFRDSCCPFSRILPGFAWIPRIPAPSIFPVPARLGPRLQSPFYQGGPCLSPVTPTRPLAHRLRPSERGNFPGKKKRKKNLPCSPAEVAMKLCDHDPNTLSLSPVFPLPYHVCRAENGLGRSRLFSFGTQQPGVTVSENKMASFFRGRGAGSTMNRAITRLSAGVETSWALSRRDTVIRSQRVRSLARGVGDTRVPFGALGEDSSV
ncbi:hypothetical protein VUR80DRAFT_9364 [Thermomyces stellatus]